MIIKNKNEIANTKLIKRALDIVEYGIKQVLPYKLMKDALKYNQLRKVLKIKNNVYKIHGRIFVVGGGKASGAMAEALEKIIGPENITEGVVNCDTSDFKTSKVKIIKAGHPIPNANSVKGVKQMLDLKRRYSIQENDLVICLISGGGSALMCYPAQGISLLDKQKTTDLLIRTGADIKEINLVRKCLSGIKAGGLTRFFAPARIVGLIISDVTGNELDVIASGPSASCTLNFHSAYNVLKKYNLLSKSPKNVVNFLIKKSNNAKQDKKKIARDCDNYIIGDIRTALNAMASYAKANGLKPIIIKKLMSGDTNKLAKLRANEIIKREYNGYDIIISGGETSLKLPEKPGKGGRNQHYVAATMLALEKYAGKYALVAMNTDGSDYLQGIAGAIIDNNSLIIARDKKIDVAEYLKKYNSYGLMERMGNSLIITGNTGTNVGDVTVYAI